MPHPKSEEFRDALTALLACSYLHQKNYLSGGSANGLPSPEEVRFAYENDPITHRFTDTAVAGVFELMKRFENEE